MVLEEAPVDFATWFSGGALTWLAVMGGLMLAFLVISYLRLAFTHGPGTGGEMLVEGIRSGILDLLRISPRRVFALARLSIHEAIRRKVLIGFGLFAIVLLLALWFLNTNTLNPSELYLSFVLSVTTYLVLLMALLISVFSLPNDLKNKTIYTVVTKPVRPSEVVLGRILGFSAIGTVMLVAMALVSYVYVVRVLDHTHEITEEDLVIVSPPPGSSLPPTIEGRTSETRNHHHRVSGEPGKPVTNVVQGHSHAIEMIERDGKKTYRVGPPEGQFHARVPMYGTLRFRNRHGHESNKGVNVGETWKYRSYVEGGTLDAAVWTFDGLTPDRFPEELLIDLTIQVFRTHKGNIDKSLLGSLVVRNPRTGLASSPHNFEAIEFHFNRQRIPRKMTDVNGNPIDLFKDLVHEGRVEIELSCLQHQQFFGMAPPDMYLVAKESSPVINFFKGYLGIWFQMLLVTSFGVMWSTFLSSAVAMLATVGTIVAGLCNQFLQDIASGKMGGGGSIEAMVRVLGNVSEREKIEGGWEVSLMQGTDEGIRYLMSLVSTMIPDFSKLSDVAYVATGYDVRPELLAIQGTTTLAYLLPVFLMGFIFFKVREVAR